MDTKLSRSVASRQHGNSQHLISTKGHKEDIRLSLKMSSESVKTMHTRRNNIINDVRQKAE
jgi:hypothetical protein